MAGFALDAITSFSVKPLRLALYAGLSLCAVSVGMFIVSLWAYLAHDTVRGWMSLTSIVLLFFAAQFLFMGLIGEYLGRVYVESKRRPLFIIDTVVCGGRESGTVRPVPRAHTVPRGGKSVRMEPEFNRYADDYRELLRDPIRDAFASQGGLLPCPQVAAAEGLS